MGRATVHLRKRRAIKVETQLLAAFGFKFSDRTADKSPAENVKVMTSVYISKGYGKGFGRYKKQPFRGTAKKISPADITTGHPEHLQKARGGQGVTA